MTGLRQDELRAEDRLLHLARREVVVVVEPDLADRADQRRRVEPGRHRGGRRRRVGGEDVRLVRMHTDGEAHRVPGPGHLLANRPLAVVLGGKDHQRAIDAGAAGPGNHRVAVGGELLAGEMAMTIDHE